MKAAAVVSAAVWAILAVAIAADLAYRVSAASPASFETGVTDCRHRCVALQSESYQYGTRTGCTCGGTLP